MSINFANKLYRKFSQALLGKIYKEVRVILVEYDEKSMEINFLLGRKPCEYDYNVLQSIVYMLREDFFFDNIDISYKIIFFEGYLRDIGKHIKTRKKYKDLFFEEFI